MSTSSSWKAKRLLRLCLQNISCGRWCHSCTGGVDNKGGHYAETGGRILLGDLQLGIVQVRAKRLGTHLAGVFDTANLTDPMKTSPLALILRAESNFDDIDLAIPPPIPIMPDTPTRDPRLVLNANFRKDGPPICSPFEYYYTTANFILEMGAAHADTPFRGLTLSYPFSRVTWSIGPTSIAAAEEREIYHGNGGRCSRGPGWMATGGKPQ